MQKRFFRKRTSKTVNFVKCYKHNYVLFCYRFGLIVGNNCFKVQDKTIANVVPDNVKEEKLITIPKDNATSSATSSKEKVLTTIFMMTYVI